MLGGLGLAAIFRRGDHAFGFGRLFFFLESLFFLGDSLGLFGVGGFGCGDFLGRSEDPILRGALDFVALRVGDVLGKDSGFLVRQIRCGGVGSFDSRRDVGHAVMRSERSVVSLDFVLLLFFRLLVRRRDFFDFNYVGRDGGLHALRGYGLDVLPLRNRLARKRLKAGS